MTQVKTQPDRATYWIHDGQEHRIGLWLGGADDGSDLWRWLIDGVQAGQGHGSAAHFFTIWDCALPDHVIANIFVWEREAAFQVLEIEEELRCEFPKPERV